MNEQSNKDWMKTQSKQKQIDVYSRVYNLMTYRKAYFGEDITVDQAISTIRGKDND